MRWFHIFTAGCKTGNQCLSTMIAFKNTKIHIFTISTIIALRNTKIHSFTISTIIALRNTKIHIFTISTIIALRNTKIHIFTISTIIAFKNTKIHFSQLKSEDWMLTTWMNLFCYMQYFIHMHYITRRCAWCCWANTSGGENVFRIVSGANISFTTGGCFMRHHLLLGESQIITYLIFRSNQLVTEETKFKKRYVSDLWNDRIIFEYKMKKSK